MNTHLKDVSLYDDWEKSTARLCEIGEIANKFIEQKYFSSEFADFFSDHSSTTLEFKKIVSYRHQFWSHNPLRSERIKKWLDEIEYFITSSLQAHNKLGVLKEFVWAKYSTLPLLISIANESEKNHTDAINKIIKSMGLVERFLQEEHDSSYELLVIERIRLAPEVVKALNKQRFLNVYEIKLPKLKKNIFCEVIETWNFNENAESIDMSLPLSIGCVASCKMCEFSLFKAINIPSATLMQIIDYQIRNNQVAPFIGKPKYSFYYLGGGDALQYKGLPALLTHVSNLYNRPNQIISTIAFGTELLFKSFLETISCIPNIGLQWSLNTFNETSRQLITGCSSLIPIKTCIELLEAYSKRSLSKVTVSIMLFKDHNDDVDAIKKDILYYLKPNIFKLNLANIQPNHLEFSKQNSHHVLIKELYAWAIEHNYEAKIDSPPEKDYQLALCGRTSNTVFNGNQPYLKKEGSHE